MANKKEKDLQKTTHVKSKAGAKALRDQVGMEVPFFPHLCGSPNSKPKLATHFRLLREK